MIVVSDASPVNILIRVGCANVLHELFGSVVIPPAVAAELSHPSTPESVRTWIANHPEWLDVKAPQHVDRTLTVGPGEREAISLAIELAADLLLVDDKKARHAAQDRGLSITGAIGVLQLGAAQGLLHLPTVVEQIRATDFIIAPAILDEALRSDAANRNQS